MLYTIVELKKPFTFTKIFNQNAILLVYSTRIQDLGLRFMNATTNRVCLVLRHPDMFFEYTSTLVKFFDISIIVSQYLIGKVV